MTPEERLARRKEFRKYLRTREGISGSDLNAVMQAAEQFVPTLIEDRFLHGFVGLYEETLDLSQFIPSRMKASPSTREENTRCVVFGMNVTGTPELNVLTITRALILRINAVARFARCVSRRFTARSERISLKCIIWCPYLNGAVTILSILFETWFLCAQIVIR